jgi:hypothetical protein
VPRADALRERFVHPLQAVLGARRTGPNPAPNTEQNTIRVPKRTVSRIVSGHRFDSLELVSLVGNPPADRPVKHCPRLLHVDEHARAII